MANAILTFKVMPESPDVDCEALRPQVDAILKEFGAKGDTLIQINPLAFGLKEIVAKGMYEVNDDLDADKIAEKMGALEGVSSAESAGMDLAMG